MIYFSIAVTSLVASFLTFFSGFGLGTILLTVFAIYYPLPIAVTLTAIVHLLNNLFKIALVFKNINWPVAIKFGLPSMISAFIGAFFLNKLSLKNNTLYTYQLFDNQFHITLLNLIVGCLIILFSIAEVSKKVSAISFDQKYLIPGGILSGFFGGLSGHQGAIRSAFLLRLNFDKKVYIATGVFVACLVDVTRLFLYNSKMNVLNGDSNYQLLLLAVLSAFVGAFIGNKLFVKTSIAFFKWFVAAFMFSMGILILSGIVN
jgi:uncharacterized membrane protein YfcA